MSRDWRRIISEHGDKPTKQLARVYGCDPKTVREAKKRWADLIPGAGPDTDEEPVTQRSWRSTTMPPPASIEETRTIVPSSKETAQYRDADTGIDPPIMPVPPGFAVHGVSTLVDPDGKTVNQWVKATRQQKDRYDALLEAVSAISEPFRGASETFPQPTHSDDDLLAVYPMGDPHIGLLAHGEETGGDNFDLKIAERNLVAAVDHLVDLAPPAKQALVINLGDFFHSDNSSNRTARSGNPLDVDGRWGKVLRIGIRAMRRCIDRALLKHELVKVVCAIGNHDTHTSVMLALCLANYYENNHRVDVDTSPNPFRYHRFGKVLIGITHGDNTKPNNLPGIMATDRAKDWGETTHRHFLCGHVHHDQFKEYPGCTVETFRTLAAKDAWHNWAGYRSGRDMQLIVYHRDHGEINRHRVGVERLPCSA